MNLNDIIRAERKKKNLSQGQLAELCGWDSGQTRISNYEKGFRVPSIDDLKQIAKALGISPTVFVDDSVMPPDSFEVDLMKLGMLPVVGKGQGGYPDRMFTDEGRPTNGHDEYAEAFSSDKAAFVTPVTGNSMYPKYVHGDYALVEPNTTPELEDDVLIRTIDGVMLKRLLSRRGLIVLGSYNEQQTYSISPEDIIWMYYVAHPIPARKIKKRF